MKMNKPVTYQAVFNGDANMDSVLACINDIYDKANTTDNKSGIGLTNYSYKRSATTYYSAKNVLDPGKRFSTMMVSSLGSKTEIFYHVLVVHDKVDVIDKDIFDELYSALRIKLNFIEVHIPVYRARDSSELYRRNIVLLGTWVVKIYTDDNFDMYPVLTMTTTDEILTAMAFKSDMPAIPGITWKLINTSEHKLVREYLATKQ